MPVDEQELEKIISFSMGNLIPRHHVIQVGLSIFKKEECNVANKSAQGIPLSLTLSRQVKT
jgi:hypothetical protein